MPRTAAADFVTFALTHVGRRVFVAYEDATAPEGERTVIGTLEAVGDATVTLRDITGRLRMVRLDRVLNLEDRTNAQPRHDSARA